MVDVEECLLDSTPCAEARTIEEPNGGKLHVRDVWGAPVNRCTYRGDAAWMIKPIIEPMMVTHMAMRMPTIRLNKLSNLALVG